MSCRHFTPSSLYFCQHHSLAHLKIKSNLYIILKGAECYMRNHNYLHVSTEIMLVYLLTLIWL